VQRFVLLENIKLLTKRLALVTTDEDRQRVRTILTAMERELTLLDSAETGALSGGGVDDAAIQAELIARFRATFEDWPQIAYLIDPAPGLHFVAVNAAFEEATGLTRDRIEGQPLFSLFPDNPDDPSAHGAWMIFASMRKVAETGQADHMAPFRYDVRDAEGVFVERYWRHANTPVFDADGRLVFLQHLADEVTEEILNARRSA